MITIRLTVQMWWVCMRAFIAGLYLVSLLSHSSTNQVGHNNMSYLKLTLF